ncbi:MAG TPA: hypothetical protein VMF04_00570 [Thermoplasmata archaeon]|nr:hypothetical protein [Thermoplasmata archaeon]
MCDLGEEEWGEYLRWKEAATVRPSPEDVPGASGERWLRTSPIRPSAGAEA